MKPKKEYLSLIDELRAQRRKEDWASAKDSDILNRMEDLYWEMSLEEQGEIENLGWLSWPDLYDEKMSRSKKS